MTVPQAALPVDAYVLTGDDGLRSSSVRVNGHVMAAPAGAIPPIHPVRTEDLVVPPFAAAFFSFPFSPCGQLIV